MDRAYHEATSLLHDVHAGLAQLDHARNENEAQSMYQSVYRQLESISSKCSQLDIHVSKEPVARRQMARMKVDQLKADHQYASNALNVKHHRMTEKYLAASQREQLLRQNYRPNETTLSFEGHELQMNDRLQSSNRQVDDLISQGAAVLENLRSQHMNLKGVRRKMMDIGAALGLSNTTIQMIDRRVREDWFIFLVGCIVCCIFMYAFYRFWKG